MISDDFIFVIQALDGGKETPQHLRPLQPRYQAPHPPSAYKPAPAPNRPGGFYRTKIDQDKFGLTAIHASCGVSVLRASSTLAKAVTIKDSGAITCFISCTPSRSDWVCQTVFIDMESLPTGILTPSRGQNSMPTACTASKSAASSPDARPQPSNLRKA